MNPLVAFFMGFTFSFAWTPCVGPALSSVLIMASGTGSNLMGNLLVAIYTIGFTLPFLLLGLFTTQVLNFLKSHQKLLKYAVKVGGALLILIGFMTFTGWMNSFSKYLNSFTVPSVEEADEQNNNRKNTSDSNDANSETAILTTLRTAIEMIIMLIKKIKPIIAIKAPLITQEKMKAIKTLIPRILLPIILIQKTKQKQMIKRKKLRKYLPLILL